MMLRFVRRTAAVLGGATVVLFTGVAGASAHVTVNAPNATQGGYTVLTFRVPTESATASTTGLKLQLPLDQPLASALVQPKVGWSVKVTSHKLPTPIKTDDGEVTEAPSEIDWTATSATGGIKPGEFDGFLVSAGPLPKAATMVFKVIQRYSDGSQVAWIEQPAAGSTTEPKHPAPTLTLAPAGDSGGDATTAAASSAPTVTASSDVPSKSSVTVALVLAVVGLVLGAAGLGLAVMNRRRPAA